MMSSGAADMATRMLPQVLDMLSSSSAAGLQEEKAQLLGAKRQMKLLAYSVLMQMSSYTKIDWPLEQLLEDARSTASAVDFEIV